MQEAVRLMCEHGFLNRAGAWRLMKIKPKLNYKVPGQVLVYKELLLEDHPELREVKPAIAVLSETDPILEETCKKLGIEHINSHNLKPGPSYEGYLSRQSAVRATSPFSGSPEDKCPELGVYGVLTIQYTYIQRDFYS